MTSMIPLRGIAPFGIAVALVAAGVALGERWRGADIQTVFAATAASDDAFAVCTTPIDDGMEGVFMLDFETGDLTGYVLNRNSAKFLTGYRHNVVKDLEFKAGKVKSPRFLLTTGVANFTGNAAANMAPAVLYVTDASTGVTAAYGIPWNGQQAAAGSPVVNQLLPLDKVKPRGGKAP